MMMRTDACILEVDNPGKIGFNCRGVETNFLPTKDSILHKIDPIGQ